MKQLLFISSPSLHSPAKANVTTSVCNICKNSAMVTSTSWLIAHRLNILSSLFISLSSLCYHFSCSSFCTFPHRGLWTPLWMVCWYYTILSLSGKYRPCMIYFIFKFDSCFLDRNHHYLCDRSILWRHTNRCSFVSATGIMEVQAKKKTNLMYYA